MTETRFKQWVHIKITDKELAEQLDAMSEADQRDRSKLVRWLIQEEWKRRQVHLVGANAPVSTMKITARRKEKTAVAA